MHLSQSPSDVGAEDPHRAGKYASVPVIRDAGSSAVYFVGDPEEIADNVKVYHDEAKLSALILSGRPLIDEAEMVSRLLLPRLAEIA